MRAYLRFLAGKERSDRADTHLALTLAFVAGAINAGGFLVVAQYTSHMTGIVSSIADNVALGHIALAAAGAAALVSFSAGAAVSAILINWARRCELHAEYALPLMVESGLLLAFGLLGAARSPRLTVLLLCFIMGLQNAIITKVSRARMRTTHVTGLVTDLGIELGKLFYWNLNGGKARVAADRDKMALLGSLLSFFLVGGLAGALAFKRLGFISTLPLALLLFAMAVVPVWDDLAARRL